MMVYYAHSKKEYGTPKESRERAFLARCFGAVYDPNNCEIDNAAKGDGELAMRLCLAVVKGSHVEALAFSVNDSGYVGKGVCMEVTAAKACGKPVFLITYPTTEKCPCCDSPIARARLLDFKYGRFDTVARSWEDFAEVANGNLPDASVRGYVTLVLRDAQESLAK